MPAHGAVCATASPAQEIYPLAPYKQPTLSPPTLNPELFSSCMMADTNTGLKGEGGG